MTSCRINFTPLLFLRFLILLAMIISSPATYAGTDTLRNFYKEQFRAADKIKELILTADEVFVLSIDPEKRRFPDDGHKKSSMDSQSWAKQKSPTLTTENSWLQPWLTTSEEAKVS